MTAVQKRFDLKPRVNRRDYFCTECKEITSIYLKGDGGRKFRGKKPFCAWCGENANIERHSAVKHGGVTGRRHWSMSELNRLKELLEQPLSWPQIAREFEGKHGISAVRRTAQRHGWVKTHSMRGKSLSEEEKRVIALDSRSQQKLADAYGVTKKTIFNIKRRYG